MCTVNFDAPVLSVTDIGREAFYGCQSLVEVKLNEGLQHIGETAFSRCTSLLQIDIPSTTLDVGSDAFAHCHQLGDVILPEGLQTIGARAFNLCRSLERVAIPSSATMVGIQAFWDCCNLSEVNLRDGVHYIGSSAFRDCPALENINIPPVALEIDVQGGGCQLVRATMPGITSGSKLVVSKWMQSRSLGQLEQAKAKVIEILGRPQLLTREEKIQCIRNWFAYYEMLDVTTMLELAIWRVNMEGNGQDAETRQAIRRNCDRDMNIIILGGVAGAGGGGVLSYLEE